jgi:glycopeptide antibiotics resistance protein
VDGVRNVALFAGFGVVWVVTSLSGRIWRSAWHAMIVGAAVSLCVETLQLFSYVRVASLLDVATNTLGTLIGAWVVCGLIVVTHRARGRRSFVGVPAFLFAGAYGTAVAAEAFTPLLNDVLLPNLGGGLMARLGRAWDAMSGSSLLTLPWLDIPLFAAAGAVAVAALVEAKVDYRRAWPIVAVGGTILCAIIEVLHGAVGIPIVLGALVVHGVSVTAGAGIAAWGLPRVSSHIRGRQRPRLLLMLYVAIVLYWSWRPFYPDFSAGSIAEQFSEAHWIPLKALAVRVDLFSVTDILAQFLLYLPIGALFAVWPLRRRGAWRGFLPALYFSVVLELGKIVVAERFFDITHILIQVAGAAVGWLVVRRSGFPVYGEVWAGDDAPRGDATPDRASRARGAGTRR